MKTLVSIKDLSVSYGSFEALSHVDLEIYPCDFLGVVGPNGGGKTTLIKSILGAIEYRGNILYSSSVQGLNGKLSIGYLPQINLYDRSFPISVLEVVMSGMQSQKGLLTRYSKEDKERALELMKKVGILRLSHSAIGEVSGGEMQRALLCRAIIANPRLLILDEPANFVDNEFEGELYDILKELNKEIAIVMVSHDVDAISAVAKSILYVNRHAHQQR